MESKSESTDVPPSAPAAPPPGIYPDFQPDMQPYQPPPPYSPPAAAVAQQPKVIMPVMYGPNSATVDCPCCRATVNTTTKREIGNFALIAAGITAMIGCVVCLPCLGLIPFCVPQCKDVKHTCPNCNGSLGNYRKMLR